MKIVHMYTNFSLLINTCTPNNNVRVYKVYECVQSTGSWDGGAVDKSVGMRTSVRCESMGMRGSMLGSMRGSMRE